MYVWERVFLTMGLVFRKNQRMANIISLNCLVVSRASPESISDHSIITLKISTDETVDQLRPMIKERWPSLFENTLPTDFILYKTTDNRSISNYSTI